MLSMSQNMKIYSPIAVIPQPPLPRKLKQSIQRRVHSRGLEQRTETNHQFSYRSKRENLKKVNPLYYKILRDLSVTPTNCLIYDNRMVIPIKLKHLVLDAIHPKHPGQLGMLASAKWACWPHILSEIVEKAQACKSCTDKGKNLKPLIPKSQLGSLPPLTELNQEIQMDFAGPIPFKEYTQNNYILVTVDRLSRYPHAETFHNCDTETALDYLERYFN